MKLENPLWLDITTWASEQDAVIRGEKSAEVLKEFEASPKHPIGLYEATKALNGVTNLVIRQNWLMGRKGEAFKGAEELTHDNYWVESCDYWIYTLMATNSDELMSVGLALRAYGHLLAPDGTIPLPECSARTYGMPKDLQDYYCDSTYLVKRWRDEQGVYGYLLVCIDPILRHTRNLHVHPTPGHAVLWINGQWVLPPHRYVSFNYDDVFHEIDRLNLPKGAFKPLEWRVNVPQVWVGVKPGRVEILYEGFFAPKRVIEFGSDYVRVRDSWLFRKTKVQEWAVKR